MRKLSIEFEEDDFYLAEVALRSRRLIRAIQDLDEEFQSVSKYGENQDLAENASAARASLHNHLEHWNCLDLLSDEEGL